MNTILRRIALCLTLLPCLAFFMTFSAVVLAPAWLFIAWASGSRRPFSEVWDMMVTDGPITMFTDAWRGEEP